MAAEEEPAIPLVKPLEALRYFRAKGFQFGFDWRDVWQDEHAAAFTVAKAMTRDLLEDIRAAVDTAIDEGETLAMFAKKLTPTLVKKGWWGRKLQTDPDTGVDRVVQLGSPHRLRTIYRTNMRTAQAAGTWERIQRSKKLFPFIEYSSVMDGRERPEHHDWDGTILPVDHPWWDTHYPPCGWGCRCRPKSRNQRMLDAKGLKVTTSPIAFPVRDYVNKRTGEITKLERGIDPGWSYNVGKASLDGLAPPPLSGDQGEAAMASTNVVQILAPFFAPFTLVGEGAIRRGRVFEDAAGWPLAISLGLFRDSGGHIVPPPARRHRHLPVVAEAIAEPLEIRLRWIRDRSGAMMLMRRYIGRAAVVDIGGRGWRFFAAGERGFDRDRLAQGEILWADTSLTAASRTYVRDGKGRFARTGSRSMRSLVTAALGDRKHDDVLQLGAAGANAPSHVQGFVREVPAARVRHAIDFHGAGGIRMDARPIASRDFELIPLIVQRGNPAIHGMIGGGKGQSISWTHRINGVDHVYVEKVGRKRKRLTMATFYKK